MMQDDSPSPTMAEVARLIAGGVPPEWLITGLQRCASGVNQNRLHGGVTPGNPMRKRLEDVARAAALLADVLGNPECLSYLEREGILHDTPATSQTLREVEARARAAARTLPIKSGRGQPGPNPDGMDARKLCALVVVEAWGAARGNYPGPRHAGAQAAADAYWQASGGPPLGLPGAVERWRRDFALALSSPPSARDLVRRNVQGDLPQRKGAGRYRTTPKN